MRILENPNYDFMRWRWHAIGVSLLILAAGLATMISRGGPPMGIDFTGGTAVVLKFAQPTPEDRVRDAINPISKDNVVQQYGAAGENKILVRLPLLGGQSTVTGVDEGDARIEAALKSANLGAFEVISKDIVGPVIGADLQRKGILATLTALGGILLYIGLRFRFSFAVGAIVASLHDILMTLVFLAWFNYDLSLNVIAAILTITGYSVNDTIVVFDRLRENQRAKTREPLLNVINRSVNQTLSRTIITAGTTFLAVFSLYLFGGDVLEGFAFTMLVGIVTGTYSTIFIASAIALVMSGGTPAGTKTAPTQQLRRA